MSTVQQVDIIDKNGKRTTVRKRVTSVGATKLSNIGLPISANDSLDFEHPSFPESEDKKTIRHIRSVFETAVEFRFEFEIENGSLYLMNRAIVLEDGICHSDEDTDEENLVMLDKVSSRIAEVYYLLGAFGSRNRVRMVDQESEARHIAIRLD